MNAQARGVYFTSGATEAANWVLTPHAPRRRSGAPLAALLVGATEHPCVLQGHRFARDRLEMLAVDGQGLVDLPALEARVHELTVLHGAGSVLVAVQAANNETGVMQLLARIAGALEASGAVLVCDAVQMVGRGPVAAGDIVFLAAHKLGGPKGIGAVVMGDDLQPEPLLKGGGQEKRQRSGTENVAAIAGFAAALDEAAEEAEAFGARTRALQQRLEAGLRDVRADTVIFGAGAPRLPNTTCFAAPGVAAETALIALDLDGVAVSSGSACSSGKVAASHTLAAMGVPASLAKGALRVSTGLSTAEGEIDAFLAAWKRIIDRRAERAVA
jgi:cysteine desulfurase